MAVLSSSPLVSIITPSYNQAAFLEGTIRSVFGQDYPRLEYIVVDGASRDGSVDIIRRHARKLAWWVSEPDSGQAEAINKGLRRATGEIIAWLNSDDLYLPGAVSSAVSVLQSDPSLGMVFGDAITIDPEGHPFNRLTFGEWGLDELAAFRIICQPSVFMRRSALTAAGFLDTSYHFMLDHHLWLRLARQASIRYLPQVLSAARHHPAAKNVAQAAAFSAETLRLLRWLESEPAFAEIVTRQRRQMAGGAYRLSARYLLDGGLPAEALRHYSRALQYHPRYALKHWHRMLYAALSLAGGQSLAGLYYRLRPARQPALSDLAGLENWPGLALEK